MPDERPTCPACRQEISFIGAGCQTCEIERLNTRVAELETVRDRSAAYAGEKAREIERLKRRLKDVSGIIHNIREAWRVDGEKWEQDKRAIEYLTERLAKCELERDDIKRRLRELVDRVEHCDGGECPCCGLEEPERHASETACPLGQHLADVRAAMEQDA